MNCSARKLQGVLQAKAPCVIFGHMFIREITKKDHQTGKVYVYHRLMEAVRTPEGPRQRIVLDLGRLDLPRSQLKILADRIEQIICGQKNLWPVDESVENLALDFARRVKRKVRQEQPEPVVSEMEPQWETVDLGSITQEEVRTIGAEALGHWAFNKLGFPGVLKGLGFSQTQITVAALLIIGRLIHPASERETFLWATERSGLDELLGTDFEKVSLSALYRLSDNLVQHREAVEVHLQKSERSLFGLRESIILYDLTNTFLTGTARESTMAKRGRSKEKRTDCPLLTLALVLDEDGFPKVSKVFDGNVGEPSTLAMILDALPASGQMSIKATPTVVIDAGVATAENIALIQSRGMDYVCVSRSRPKQSPEGERTVIKTGPGGTVQGIRLEQDGEILLYCESTGRSAKEQGIRDRFQKRFEEGIAGIAASLEKPRGVKSYDKVLERVGRLRERYSSIAQFYEITVEKTSDQATVLTWRIHNEEALRARFCGGYLIRSSRKDLNEERLWSLYTTLTLVEESFRSLKSDLGLRPMYHRKDRRLEGHLFISVCAYHLLATLQRRLRKEGIVHNWEIIRMRMGSQCRVTASMTNDKGQRIHIRQTTESESFHREVYRALGMHAKPLMSQKTVS
jgi:transposase